VAAFIAWRPGGTNLWHIAAARIIYPAQVFGQRFDGRHYRHACIRRV